MRRSIVLIGLLTVLGAPAGADTIDEITTKLADTYKQLKSFTADFQTTQDMAMNGMTMKMDLKGTMEWARAGDTVKFRIEQKGKSEQSYGGQTQKNDMEMMLVCDGRYVYTLNNAMGRQMAMKMDNDPKYANSPTETIAQMKKNGELKVLDDEKCDGADCYVIEVSTTPAGPGPVRQRYWFRKDMGMQVKMVSYDKDGKEVMVTTTKNIKLNPTIADERFTFKAPEGVRVTDMTNKKP